MKIKSKFVVFVLILSLLMVMAGCDTDTSNVGEKEAVTPADSAKDGMAQGEAAKNEASSEAQSQLKETLDNPMDSGGTKLAVFEFGTEAYKLLDPATNEVSDFLPEGYNLIPASRYAYPQNTPYLILKKDNDLYAYSISTKEINKVGTATLKETDMPIIQPSITDPSKFYINVLDTVEEEGMYGFKIVGMKTYFYDAVSKELKDAPPIEVIGFEQFNKCYEYDSGFARLLVWSCGEGIGSATPLQSYDLNSRELTTVMAKEDVGAKSEAGVFFRQGKFLVYNSEPDAAEHVIVVVEPTKELNKTRFTYESKIIENIRPYSAYFLPEKNLFVFGGADALQLLKFDTDNRITSQISIPAEASYLNFIYNDQTSLYMMVKNELWIVDPVKGEVIKKIPSAVGGEIVMMWN